MNTIHGQSRAGDNLCRTPDSVVGTERLHRTISLDQSLLPSDSPDDEPSSPHLFCLLASEASPHYEITLDYLHSTALTDSEDAVSERCRRKTCEWMYDIIDYFHLNREAVGAAMFYVDRYFTLEFDGKVPILKTRFQLVALTALYMAIKIRGECRNDDSCNNADTPPWNRLKLTIGICASISRNVFKAKDIEECECDILQTLNWYMNPVVPSGDIIDLLLTYLPSILAGGCAERDVTENVQLHVYDCAKYLAELSVSVPALCLIYRPSIVAYASIMCSLDTTCVTERQRLEYIEAVSQASSGYFGKHRKDVESAHSILKVICPNLSVLIPVPPAMSSLATAFLLRSPTVSAFVM